MKNGLIKDEYGNSEYWLDGLRHRECGPAVECNNGHRAWYINGLLHREGDLPAVESYSGDRYWYKRGMKHRDSGPAVIKTNGDRHWYLDGKRYLEKEFKSKIRSINEEGGHNDMFKSLVGSLLEDRI